MKVDYDRVEEVSQKLLNMYKAGMDPDDAVEACEKQGYTETELKMACKALTIATLMVLVEGS